MENKLGQLVRSQREHLGISQARLGRSVRRSGFWVSAIESGLIRLSRYHRGGHSALVKALAKALKLPFRSLTTAILLPRPNPGSKIGNSEKPCRTELGKFVRAQRHRQQLSQRNLALKCGYTEKCISHIETGWVKRPRKKNTQRLAEALACPAMEIEKLYTPWPRRGPGTGRSMAESTSNLGRLIRARRMALNISQAELAQTVGLTAQSISLIELGRITLAASSGLLNKLAQALEIVSCKLRELQPDRRVSRVKPRASMLGQFITDQRRERGIKQYELARMIGVAQYAIWAYESGKTCPSPKRLRQIAAALGFDSNQASQC